MSRWSRKRKIRTLSIIFGLIILFAALIILIFFRKSPTCFDMEQNGDELGVDCGGSCVLRCEEQTRDLVVWWERPFKVTDGVYSAVAYFENQNLDAGIEEITYEFRLYDYDNVLVTQPIVGTTFVEPNKRQAVFESAIGTGDQEPYTAFFKILSNTRFEQTPESFSYGLFNIGEPMLSNQDRAPKLQVPITNNTFTRFTNVPVIVILYNEQNNAVAASKTFIDSFDQNELQTAYFSWPEPFGETITRVEVLPRINPFLYESVSPNAQNQ